VLNYDSAKKHFPAGAIIHSKLPKPPGCACRGTAFYMTILPYLEGSTIEDLYDYSSPDGWATAWGSNPDFYRIPNAIYVCPSEQKWAEVPNRRSYFGVVGGKKLVVQNPQGHIYRDGVMYANSNTRTRDITDGTSKTLMAGECTHPHPYGIINYGDFKTGGPAHWADGGGANPDAWNATYDMSRSLMSAHYPINFDMIRTLGQLRPEERQNVPAGSMHPGGAQFVFSDGHVQFLSDTISHNTYKDMSSRNGGESSVQ
jgi:prepilin-type processing-associated H-X9-DG protein